MSHTHVETTTAIAEHIANTAEAVFELVAGLRARVEELFARIRREGRAASTADLAEIDPIAIGMLGEAAGIIPGAGFIVAPHVLSDAPRWLQWWTQQQDGSPARLVVELNPDRDRFYDYANIEWFAVPRDTGRRHVTGPYVDYLCTDEYSLTFTDPAYVHGEFVGVAGADVFVSRYESLVLPQLRSLPSSAALVNAQGRVIVSNSARLVVGSLVRQPDVAAFFASGQETARSESVDLRRCGKIPIALLVQAEAAGQPHSPREPGKHPNQRPTRSTR